MTDNLKARGQEPEVHGLPVLDLDTMSGTSVPEDFEFEAVFGDIIMIKIIDENATGEVFRNGIWVPQDMSHKVWRRGEVVMKGPDVPSNITIGCHVAYPSDRGISMVVVGKGKYIFLNMERLFGKLKPIIIPTN